MRPYLLLSVFFLMSDVLSAQPTPRPGWNATKTTLTRTEASKRQGTTTQQQAPQQPVVRPTAKAAAATPATVAPLKAQKMPEGITWLTLDEAVEKSKTDKKKIFIDVYTDWCGWCKRMEETTFSDPELAAYLNENYYAVKFNAEQSGAIAFKDKTYQFKRAGARGYHELAAEWLNNRLTFPTLVFLDENLNVIQPLPGYQDAPKLQAILHYFGTDSHKNTPWETFERKYANQK